MRKPSLTLFCVAILSSAAYADDRILIPDLQEHPRSTDINLAMERSKTSNPPMVDLHYVEKTTSESYTIKFDGGAIVAGKDHKPLVFMASQNGQFSANPFCRIFPICNERPVRDVTWNEPHQFPGGVDLIGYPQLLNESSAILDSTARRINAEDIETRLNRGDHLYQLKGLAILAPNDGRDPLLVTNGQDGNLVAFPFCRIFPFCNELREVDGSALKFGVTYKDD